MKKMTKFLALAAVGAMLVGCLSGCGNDKGSEAGDNQNVNSGNEGGAVVEADYKLLTPGVLAVGSDVAYPPFEDFADDGTTPIGVDIEIITEVAKRLGLEVNIINTAWDGIFEGIDVNYDAVISGVTITEERKASMLFSDSYIKNYQSVVVMVDSDMEVGSFFDLAGETIAVQKETTSDILMSDYKDTGSLDVQIVANERVISCFSQLENGEVDAVVCDSTVATVQVARYPEKFKIIYTDADEAEEFGIAMGKENTGLQAAINAVLKEMMEDGTIDEILAYWFG